MIAAPENFTESKGTTKLEIRSRLKESYDDLFTPQVMAALTFLAGFNTAQKAVMSSRMQRRAQRALGRHPINFLDPNTWIPRFPTHLAAAGTQKQAGELRLRRDKQEILAQRRQVAKGF